MVVAVVAEAIIILVLIALYHNTISRWMRYIGRRDGVPVDDKPHKTMIISPYKKKKHKSNGGESGE